MIMMCIGIYVFPFTNFTLCFRKTILKIDNTRKCPITNTLQLILDVISRLSFLQHYKNCDNSQLSNLTDQVNNAATSRSLCVYTYICWINNEDRQYNIF